MHTNFPGLLLLLIFMKLRYVTIITFSVAALILGCHGTINHRPSQIIAEPGSASSEVEFAMQQDQRRRCVKFFCDNFVKPGTRLGDVVQVIGNGRTWISCGGIKKEQREGLVGWLPEVLLTGKSAFSIPLVSGERGSYHVVVLVSFQDDLRLDDLVNALNGRGESEVLNTLIVNCAGWDSEDQERVFPGSELHRWPW